MKNTDNNALAHMSSPVSVRFTPHIDYLITAKSEELGRNRSDTVRYIVDSYFDKEIQDPELIYAVLNDTKKRINEMENRQDLLLVTILETARKLIRSLPTRPSISEEIENIEFDRFMNNVKREFKKSDRGKIESMVLDIYQKEITDES